MSSIGNGHDIELIQPWHKSQAGLRGAAGTSSLGRISMQVHNQSKGVFSLDALLSPQNVIICP